MDDPVDTLAPPLDADADTILKYLLARSGAARGAVLAFAGSEPELAVVACEGGPAVATLARVAGLWRDHQRVLGDGQARVIEDAILAPLLEDENARRAVGLLYLSRPCDVEEDLLDSVQPELVEACQETTRREPLYTESYLASISAEELERLQLSAALRRHRRIVDMARVLKLTRKTVSRKLRRLGLLGGGEEVGPKRRSARKPRESTT